MNKVTKVRFDNLDLLKAVAMLMVVSLHIPVWGPEYPMERFLPSLLSYAFRLVMEGVPIFVMVNGFLMFRKRELALGKHLKKIIHFVLLLWIWSFVMIIGGMVLTGEPISLEAIFSYFFSTRVGSKYTGVLWFLQSLIGLYLLMPILKIVYNANYKCYKYLFCIVAFFAVGIDTIELLLELLAPVIHGTAILSIPGYLERFGIFSDGSFVLFAMLGGILWRELEYIEQKRYLFAGLGLGAWLAAILCGVILGLDNHSMYNPTFNYGSIFMVFILVGWYAATLSYQNQGKWYHKVIRSIGENTLGIYFLHIFVIAIVRMLLPFESVVVRLVQWGIVFIASWLGSVMMKRIPIVKNLVC